MEEALRRAADQAESEQAQRAAGQLRYFEHLPERVDLDVLAAEKMWR